ncbi:MAG: hypothetical protein JW825_00100 [Candidatus Methanofastidiosa archaeon]|nr:hypothetical protein [Candidatus Methanofastidiosa archaeon]
MKRSNLIVILLLIGVLPGLCTSEEASPTVTILNDPLAIPGQEYTVDVTISGAYIENSVLEIDFETAPGWGYTEQGYFDFTVSRHEIDVLQADETLTLTFVMTISGEAAEKSYTIPIIFYGKSGECESGCVPFRSEHSFSLSILYPERADEREVMADSAFDEENYSLAKMYYEQAKTLYEALENSAKASEMAAAIEDSQTGILASQLYGTGLSKYNAGNKEGALTDFLASKEKYEEIGNSDKVLELEDLIESCQANGNGEPPIDEGDGGLGNSLLILVGVGLVIGIAVVGILIKYK